MVEHRYWGRILTVVVVGALAAFGLLGGLVSPMSWSARLMGLFTCFVYAISIGGLMGLMMPPILSRFPCATRLTRWLSRLAVIAVLIVLGCMLAGLVLIVIRVSRPDEYWVFLRGSLWISFLVGTVASLAATAYETMRSELDAAEIALKTKQLEEEQARKLAIEAQLAALESRVHPHFLFNTLNSISALVHDDPAGAERVVGQLASILRSSLDGGAVPLVRLDDELGVVRNYLEIERIRFGERLRYSIEAPQGASPALVPRLALQTLVENCVKFAVSPRRSGAAIAVRGTLVDNGLRLEVIDDGPGFDGGAIPDGHGLALVRDRLAMIFDGRAAFAIDSAPGSTCVSMILPLDGASAS
jgi:sensor histidine kinase YesM